MGILQLMSRLVGCGDIAWGTGAFSWTDENGISHTMAEVNAAQIPTSSGVGLESRIACWVRVTNTAELQAAVTAVGSVETPIYLGCGVYEISANYTIPTNIYLHAEASAMFTILTGATLTINGALEAGLYQIFSCTGTGKVVFGNNAVKEVCAEWWGVIADGITECSVALRAAATCAGTAGLPLHLPSGTIISSQTTTIDLTGIPELSGIATIDCSAAMATSAFQCFGSKTLIGGPVAVANGAHTATVNNDTYPQGMVVLIAADENVPNTERDYLRKGGRHFSGDAFTGTSLPISPPTDYAYTNAYIWKVTEATIKIGNGITFIGNPAVLQIGLALRFDNADIAGTWRCFSHSSVSFGDSRGKFHGTVEKIYSAAGAGYAYGVMVNDLSDVEVDANISGGRHCAASGGGDAWNANELGGAPKSISLPANVTVTGGSYVPDPVQNQGAIDSHPGANSLVVTGGRIVGGILLASRYATVTGADIGYHDFPAIRFGENNSLDWGDYVITGNTIHSIGATSATNPVNPVDFSSSTYCARSIKFDNKVIVAAATNDAAAGSFSGHTKYLDIGGDWFINSSAAAYLSIYQYGSLQLSAQLQGITVEITPKALNLDLVCRGLQVLGSKSNGLNLVADAGGSYANVCIDGVVVKGSTYDGIQFNSLIYNYILRNITSRNNGVSGIDLAVVDATAKSIILSDNDLQDDQAAPTQDYGFLISGPGAGTVRLYLSNNNGNGCVSGNSYGGAGLVVKAQTGNRESATPGRYPDCSLGSDGNLYKYNGAAWVAGP